MSSFLSSVFRGVYPLYLFFVVWGIAARFGSRRWRPFDTLLLAGFLLFEFFAALQAPLFYGVWETSSRYMVIGVPLYLPFAAEGLIGAWDVLKRKHRLRLLTLTVFSMLMAVIICKFYSPIVRQSLLHKRIDRRISQRTAAWIRKDWHPQPAPADFDRMKCDQYRSGRRPLVWSEKWSQVGYLCGGQQYPEFFGGLGIPADYAISPERDEPFPGYARVGMIEEGGETAYIYKWTGGEP